MLGDEPISDAYAANAEFWIRIVRDDLDPYRSGLTDPALLALIGDCAGLHILDAGCGEGCLTRELITRGAGFVDGVDTCAEFVAAAASHPAHDPARARFRQADVAALPLPDDSVDLVVASRLPHGLSDPGRRFVEFARVVRPAGRLVMVTMHRATALRGRGDALPRRLRASVVFTGSDDRDAHHRRIRDHRHA
ncbi:putative S-adenosylmethionine-dependent methyltransferase [Nocardia cerradoensis]|uniref:Putative S-adenosylmethionine-dependent methyltransferase n=1 Tax=Nocardia cerradoensis TaxID=85688 RepID=A0A231HAB1_9NOCA|nr:class I SAM-dependent methyltransferase [Nocardia cerradoensis]OXR45781.1 putative S-adenosylmethionine-dependent methyltransferase [Nocardia cerradoensis]